MRKAKLVFAIIDFVLSLPFIFYHGWAVHCLWSWFVTPLVNITPSVLHCMGLMYFVHLIIGLNFTMLSLNVKSHGNELKEEHETQIGVTKLLTSWLFVSIVLLVAYLIHLGM